ncbi:hypothetical protein PORY_000036 [Pneumocystis oryctolagi]|uniref:Uncharacterized protein n=1 Tax=Pneumocystis oryctolagi TaxID=42067 RepID=A0ACB7CG76_9ASCO|nr:hypothetical protein PORY_000036 [Pneumocystis oryctolagi]
MFYVFQRWDPYDKDIKDYLEKSQKKIGANLLGLSSKETKIMKKARKSAYRLDYSARCFCCEMRFGWSAVIGMIPVIGDVINMYLSVRLVRLCMNANLPYNVVIQMYTNIIIAFTIGIIPIIGDILFTYYKCNIRNYILFEKILRERGKVF